MQSPQVAQARAPVFKHGASRQRSISLGENHVPHTNFALNLVSLQLLRFLYTFFLLKNLQKLNQNINVSLLPQYVIC